MFKSRLVVFALAACAAAFLSSAAKADTLTYNFSYTGTGTYVSGETATGTGSITLSFNSVGSGTATVTAFSFTDTLTAPSLGSSVFTYGLSDLSSTAIVIGGTLANPVLTNLQLQTKYVAGTNSSFSSTDFNFAYSPAVAGSTADQHASVLADFTNGSGTLTIAPVVVSAVPEPSSYVLFATGLAGMSFLYVNRKRLNAALMP